MRIFILLFFIGLSLSVSAQVASETHYLERYAHPQKSPFSVQLKVGLTGLETPTCSLMDFNDQNYFLKPNIAIGAGYQITNRIGLLLRGGYYRHSCKAKGDFPGVKSDNFEGVLAVKHYLFPMKHFDEYYRRFNYYALVGGGLLYINPRDGNTGEPLANTYDFDKFTWVVPIGVGTEFRVSNFFLMALEANYHITGASYLDGTAATSVRSSRSRDNFVSLGVNVTFRLPHSEYKYQELLKLKNMAE